jgi:hypothetical protein
MLLMGLFKSAPNEGEQRTFQAQPGIVETIAKGRLSGKLVAAAAADFERLGVAPIWVFETIAVNGFDTDIVRVGAAVLQKLKNKGLKRVVGIIPSSALRMAARAASLTSGVDVRLVQGRLEAAQFLKVDG